MVLECLKLLIKLAGITGSLRNYVANFLQLIIARAISCITQFFLSTTPLCGGVIGAENSCLMPNSSQKSSKTGVLEFLFIVTTNSFDETPILILQFFKEKFCFLRNVI
jgi:hypothetical protein